VKCGSEGDANSSCGQALFTEAGSRQTHPLLEAGFATVIVWSWWGRSGKRILDRLVDEAPAIEVVAFLS